MTVPVVTPQNTYTGTGLANTYSFGFAIYTSSQILVTIKSPAAVSYTLTLGVDYLVTGLNASGNPASTGSIVLINSGQAWLTGNNLTLNWTLTIQSNFPLTQAVSIRNGGDFYRSALENALDYLMQVIQQVNLSITGSGGGGGGGGTTTVIQVVSPYLIDQVTGNIYSLIMVNGEFSQQQISAVPGGVPQNYFTIKDTSNGHTYQIVSTNGIIGLQQIT